ncbi:hypothetical protein AAMO2058_001495700 [Amorphochlora amoebiformis]
MPLNGLDDRKNAKRFLHRIVDETCGQEVDWSEDEDLGLIADLKSVFKKTVGQDQKTSEAVEELKGDGCSEASQKAFEAVLEGRRSDIKKALVESASQIFPSYLKDFDWSLKTVLASNKLADIGSAIVVLSLTLKQPDGSIQTKRIELSGQLLDHLVKACGAANKVVRQVSHDSE